MAAAVDTKPYEQMSAAEQKDYKTSMGTIKRYPSNASSEYINARQTLIEAEWDLRNHIEKVAAMRRALPKGAVMKDYTFDAPDGKKMTLADLAADGRSVIIYHLMFTDKDPEPWSMCASFVDTQNAIGKHLAQRLNFAVIAKAPIEKIDAYAKKRGWNNIRFLSSANNDFAMEMQMEYPAWVPECEALPGLSVFRKDDDGKVRHVYSSTADFAPHTQRGMDLMAPLWHFLDLTPEGRANFCAGNDYVFED